MREPEQFEKSAIKPRIIEVPENCSNDYFESAIRAEKIREHEDDKEKYPRILSPAPKTRYETNGLDV